MMTHHIKKAAIMLLFGATMMACDDSDSDDETGTTTTTTEGLHAAFAEFDEDNTDIYIEDGQVVIETNGLPNHTSPYWGEGHELYSEVEEGKGLTPSTIPNYDGSATLRLSTSPGLATTSTATTLGAIGISVSGAALFNDQEGGGTLDEAAGGLDYSGGHIGPAEYHYHISPTAFTDDDSNLVGVMADGFFIYGRKCNSTGTYPTNLDESGGHTHTTQHSTGDEYHYHIVNEPFLEEYYIIFAGDFQGDVGSIEGSGTTGGGMMGGPPQ